MQWIRAHVAIYAEAPQLTADLVAGIFFDLKVKGVEVDDPELTPAEGWGEDAVALPSQHGVCGYFPDSPSTAKHCEILESEIESLRRRHGGDYKITYQRVNEEDWAEAWKEFFWPERITPRLVVKPTWREYATKADDIVIEIDPGMAFGTGTHPTTALCLGMIEKYLKSGDSFLDIGTGSGILMVAAARLGARPVHGVDNDEVAVAVAEKNLRLNGIDPNLFCVSQGDLATTCKERYQLVVANILSEVILMLLDDIQRVIEPQGIFICSGIIAKNKGAVLAKIARTGLKTIEVAEKEEWVAIAACPSS